MASAGNNTGSDWNSWWQEAGGYKENQSVAWDLMDSDKTGYLLDRIGRTQGRLLEVGCGTARMSVRLARVGYSTVCLDNSIFALSLARENYSKCKWTFAGLAGDGYRLPFSDNAFDGVLSTGLLEHFRDPIPLIKEMVRVTRPGGFIYADILPKKKWRLLLLFDFIRPLFGRYTDDLFEMPFSRDDILGFLQTSGLKEAEVFPAGIYWPRWPVLRSSRLLVGMENTMCRITHPLFKALDRSFFAEIFGIYYFMMGRKP
ncbi:MAG: class I SAM-dependent methyltransferase [Deltaproteobacteria bacterium]|nr:class I SAM-dependent methyltransferase [Deltaproteobacteria bacterium]